ncbi:hypothetical protein [Marichromatium purpuratum]|uniref:hypothetical protein n=1 Tax=Marichromatium purpuratum TaxID=37487 RepID=UPI0012EB5CDC|nr:hypothetical protein [Marichromatium purpuratum]
MPTTVRLSVKSIVGFLFILIFFAGYQGGKYFANNRFQEVGLALTFLLFFYGAVFTALTDRTIRWSWWFWSAPLIVGYVMLSSSAAFALNAGVPIMPSLFASREFLILFLAPTLYFLYRLGFAVEDMHRLFVTSLVIIILNYILSYHRVDLEAAYFSTGYMSYLVTYDEWRGYRLKPPTFALIILTCYASIRLFQDGSALRKLLWVVPLLLVGYVWSLIMARSQMATVAMAMLLYPIFLSRPNRANLLVLVVPVGLMLLLAAGSTLVDAFMNAEGADVRAKAYVIAWQTALEHPVIGFGQSSGYSKTYQDVFGPKFFPDDLGIVGTAFKYGFLGVFLYLFANFYVLSRLIKTNWYYRKRHGVHHPLIWSLLMMMTALTLNLILNPGLAYMQGLTTAAFAVGITACLYEDMGLVSRARRVVATTS